MLQEKDTVSLDMRILSIVWAIISISSKYVTIRIFILFSTDTGTFSNFVGAGQTSNISRAIPKDSLTMKTEHSSLMADAVELKNKRLSYSTCTCNLPLTVIHGGKTNLPFWNAFFFFFSIITLYTKNVKQIKNTINSAPITIYVVEGKLNVKKKISELN